MAVLFSFGGAETLTGSDGVDLIFSLGAGSTLVGAGDDDWIFAGGGDDVIFGDSENGPPPRVPPADPTAPGGPGDNVIFAGGGADTVYAGYGSDTVRGGAGDDVIFGYGGGRMPSPSAFEFSVAFDGADHLHGGAGADSINGGGGADTLEGGCGADTLQGHRGADLLMGDEGADVFLFTRGTGRTGFSPDTGVGEGNRDIIADFAQGEDRIDLFGYRNPIGPNEEPIFLAGDPFQARVALQVRVEALENGNTLIQIFGPVGSPPTPTPDPIVVAEIELVGSHELTREDFIL